MRGMCEPLPAARGEHALGHGDGVLWFDLRLFESKHGPAEKRGRVVFLHVVLDAFDAGVAAAHDELAGEPHDDEALDLDGHVEIGEGEVEAPEPAYRLL